MTPLWLVEKGPCLQGLSLNEPTAGALMAHGMTACTVRRSPIAPTQLTISGAEEVFNLSAQPIEPTKNEELERWKKRQEHHEFLKGLEL